MGITSRLAALAVGMAVLSAPAAAQTPTADELVAKYLTARGGVDKIKAVNTARIAGTVSAAGQDLQLTVVSKRPNKMRQEVMVQGQKMIQAFDGTTAWGVNPMTGNPSPQVMEGPQADLIKTQALFDGPLGTSISNANTALYGAQLGLRVTPTLSVTGNIGYASSDLQANAPIIGGFGVADSRTLVYDGGLELALPLPQSPTVRPFESVTSS